MKLLIKQRVFSLTDTYDVYDENQQRKYFVKSEFLSLGHRIHVYDLNGNEIGSIHQKIFALLPVFELVIGGQVVGTVNKKFTMFRPKYEVNCRGWRVEGDFMSWEYDVYQGCSSILHISKQLLAWGDTYVLDYQMDSDEIMGLLLVIAIDAANCSQGNN